VDLRKEDLIKTCQKCGGSGHLKETNGRWTREGPCEECGGRGGTLTEAGMAVAEVVRWVRKGQ
jgi:DnaJ-class molecular chaperone